MDDIERLSLELREIKAEIDDYEDDDLSPEEARELQQLHVQERRLA